MKKTIDTNYTFSGTSAANLTLASLAEGMSRHVGACGVTVSASECAHVLAAMASHRLLYVESESEGDGGLELACAVASFLGCDCPATVANEKTASLADLWTGKSVNAPLFDKLSSFVGSGRICAAVIDNRAGIDLSEGLSVLDGYFSAENESYEFVSGAKSLVLPKNTYFIIVLPKGRAIELLGKDMSYFACPVLCERLNTLVVNDDAKAPMLLGAESFCELCDAAYKSEQPKEELWRSIDKIDAFLNPRLGGFGNDGYLTMERYFSVYASCTGNILNAVDAFIAHFISSIGARLSKADSEAFRMLVASLPEGKDLQRTLFAISKLSF